MLFEYKTSCLTLRDGFLERVPTHPPFSSERSLDHTRDLLSHLVDGFDGHQLLIALHLCNDTMSRWFHDRRCQCLRPAWIADADL